MEEWRRSPQFWRNAVEYAILAVVFWRIQASKRPDAMAQKLGVWDKDSAQALVGTRWRLNLDIGREVGTWMPPGWARSGRRIEIPVAVELQEGGVVQPLGIATYIKFSLSPGTWNVQGDTLRLNLLLTDNFERGDLTVRTTPPPAVSL